MSHHKEERQGEGLAGQGKGRQGKVLKIFKEKDTALVERLNMVKRHTRAGGKAGQQGGIIEKEAPIKLSKVDAGLSQMLQTHTDRKSETLDDGTRVRYCKKCSEQLDS